MPAFHHAQELWLWIFCIIFLTIDVHRCINNANNRFWLDQSADAAVNVVMSDLEIPSTRAAKVADRISRTPSFSESIRQAIFVPRPEMFWLVQGGGLLAVIWALGPGNVSAGWWLLALIAYFASSCLGISITFHRALTHKSFRMAPLLEKICSFFGAIGAIGSPLGWIAVHRTHHASADTHDDPHSPEYMGWRILYTGPDPIFDWWRVRDILRDPFQRFCTVTICWWWLAGWAILLFAIHPLAMVFGFLIPGAAQITITNLSTILGHGWGYRNFDTRDHSTNNVLISMLTWGDGWHNNHHASPSSWTIKTRYWELDPASWVIRLMVAMGGIDRRSFAVNSPYQP